MSIDSDPDRGGLAARLAAARRADGRARARLSAGIDDFFLGEQDRLDDRMRLLVTQMLDGIVRGIETDIRGHATRLLSGHAGKSGAAVMSIGQGRVTDRLARAGLLRDRPLMDELIARARGDVIAQALPIDPADAHVPSLLIRLAESGDSVVAAAARAMLAAETQRRAAAGDVMRPSDLPADLHHRLLWWIAAAIRETALAAAGDDPATDRAIVDAAQRSLSAHDEGDRAESIGMRLALAIDARADELGPLLVESLRDRRLILFIACIAHALQVDYDGARALVLEPEGDRLWLALRACDLDRATVARIGLSLADADPRRDLDRFADEIDLIAAIPVDVARTALAPLTLHHDLRLAIDALARTDER
jgi:hypothetical protein